MLFCTVDPARNCIFLLAWYYSTLKMCDRIIMSPALMHINVLTSEMYTKLIFNYARIGLTAHTSMIDTVRMV